LKHGPAQWIGTNDPGVGKNRRAEIARAISRNGYSFGVVGIIQGHFVLFPAEEEKGLVPAVVDFGNPRRTAEGIPVVVSTCSRPDVMSRAIVGIRLAGIQEFVHE